MSETQVYRPGSSRPPRRREQVLLSGGFHVWVWGMTLAEFTQISERSARPEIDKRGGHNQGMAVALQIQLSCYDGGEEGAARIWEDNTRHDIFALPVEDMTAILGAVNRVNGQDASAEEILRDFTRAASESKT